VTRYISFPRTKPPPIFTENLVSVFEEHRQEIDTVARADGLRSNEVLGVLRKDLEGCGFEVENGKREKDKIKRPVFFGEGGKPTLKYEVDAYHPAWRCGLEVEAGRAWRGNAVYRDLIQAMVMVRVDVLALAVPKLYKWSTGESEDFDKTASVVEALYGHSRVEVPYRLLLIGY
jgi:hypothetical protein